MQIDTRNRDGSMKTASDGFTPDPNLVPKAYAAPLTGPDAVYSGLLECPCTDRITKAVAGAYSLQADGDTLKKGRRIATYMECFAAASKLGLPNSTHVTHKQGSNKNLPAGCSLRIDPASSHQSVYFNHLEEAAPCGGSAATSQPATSSRVSGATSSLVQLHLDLDASTAAGNATITITGPASQWFGVAFGATQMKQKPAAIIVSETGVVSEWQLGDHVAGTKLTTQVVVLSNTVSATQRTVVLSRTFKGSTAAQYTFQASGSNSTITFMNAVGSAGTAWPSFHKHMSSSSITMAKLGVANCLVGEKIIFGKTRGSITYHADDNTTETLQKGGSCHNSTPTDLIATRNPICDVTT